MRTRLILLLVWLTVASLGCGDHFQAASTPSSSTGDIRNSFLVSLPTGNNWQVIADGEIDSRQGTYTLAVANASRGFQMMVMVLPGIPEYPTVELMKDGWEKGFLKKASRKKMSQGMTVDGRDAHLVVGEIDAMDGSTQEVVGILLVANGRNYSLMIRKPGNDILNDPEVQAFVNSFRITAKNDSGGLIKPAEWLPPLQETLSDPRAEGVPTPLAEIGQSYRLPPREFDASETQTLESPAASRQRTPIADETVDLLASASQFTKIGERVGNWKLSSQSRPAMSLTSSASDRVAYQVLAEGLPESYRVSIDLEMLGGEGSFNLALPVGRQRAVTLVLDGWGSKVSGLNMIRGKTGDMNETTHHKPVLRTSGKNVIEVTVNPGVITATVNGEQIVNWTGSETDLSIDGRFWPLPTSDRRLWVGSWLTSYRVTRCELTALAP